jgi:hypothetical protein
VGGVGWAGWGGVGVVGVGIRGRGRGRFEHTFGTSCKLFVSLHCRLLVSSIVIYWVVGGSAAAAREYVFQ